MIMQLRQTDTRDPGRPFGLHFIVDAVNAPNLASAWPALTKTHGEPRLGELDTSPEPLAAAARALRDIFATREPRQAATSLNRMLAERSSQPELAELADGRWALRPALTDASTAADTLAHVGAFALATWLAERGRCAWGLCEATDCDRAFIDEGRRAPQRFCSSTCATRTRVALHRTAAASGEATA